MAGGRDGVQTKGTCPLAPSTESGLAEEFHLHRGQKSSVDKSPLGALKIRGHSWISLLCLSVLISKMGTSGAYEQSGTKVHANAEPRVQQSLRTVRIKDCLVSPSPQGTREFRA